MQKIHKVLMLVENLSVPADPRVWREARTLRQHGFQVSIISPKGETRDQESYACIEDIHIYRYRLAITVNKSSDYVKEYAIAMLMTFLLSLKVLFRHGFDVIHAANPPDAFFVIALFYRLFGKKYIFDQHDLAPEMFHVKFQNRLKLLYKLLLFFERCSYRTAHLVITTNTSQKRNATERGHCRPDKVFIVRNGPDIRRFSSVPLEPELKQGRRYLLAYVGVMGAQDGVEYALYALDELVHKRGRQDVSLVLMGDGDKLPMLCTLTSQLQLGEYVHFTGWLKTKDMLRYLAVTDVGLSPDPSNELNDRSTMLKTMDYMAMGKPVVAFDLPETCFSAQVAALYATPNCVEEFADKIETLLDNEELRRTMGAFGRKRVEEVLCWDRTKQNLLLAYKALFVNSNAESSMHDKEEIVSMQQSSPQPRPYVSQRTPYPALVQPTSRRKKPWHRSLLGTDRKHKRATPKLPAHTVQETREHRKRKVFHINMRSLLIVCAVLFALPSAVLGIRHFEKSNSQIPASCYNSIDPVYQHTNVRSLIHIANEQDALQVRNEIIQTIWKNRHLPTSLPSQITRNIPNPIPELKNVSSVDEIDINLPESGTPYQFNAVVYFFHPTHDANKLMIFHQGHADTLQVYGGFDTMQFFLTRGYSVLGFFMPLLGPNRTTNPKITARGADGHDQMPTLETDMFNPLEIFLDPLLITLRYIKQHYIFSTISMIGVSGGGWTTTLYAAIDPTIQYSYPVAGSLPLFLRTAPCNDSDDWEQFGPSLYKKIDYMDLYILGAYGKGRKQIQMLNHYDSCCFEGSRYLTYENTVQSIVSKLGKGEFDVFLDNSFRYDHKISLYALEHVFPPTSTPSPSGKP